MTSLSTELTTGDGRTLTVSDVVQLYRNGVNLSVPSQGKIQRLGENVYSLTNRFSTVDCDTLESVKTFKVYSLSTRSNIGGQSVDSVRCVSDAHDVSELASATSENGRFLARLKSPTSSARDNGSSDGPKRQLLEIWDRSKLLKTIDTSELDAHGSINTDSQFSSLFWSRFGEQDKLLYVCQRKRAKYLSFFKEPTSRIRQSTEYQEETFKGKPPLSPIDSANANRGQEFNRKEDWGESLTGIEHTIVAVLDVSNNFHITTIDVDGYSLGNPQWLDNDTKIVSVAYKENPRRLGLIYCNNRVSKIMVHDWQSSPQGLILELEGNTDCFHTPRVNYASDKFIYLANPVYGAHKHSVKLYIHDLRTRAIRGLIDASTKKAELFIEDLPRNCFTSDDKHILLVTTDHLYHYMTLYNLDNSKLSRIKFPTTGLSILDFRYDIILASGSEVNATPTLFVAALSLLNTNDVVAWHQIEDFIHLDEVEYEPYEIPTPDESNFVSALLIRPNLRVLQENFADRASKTKDKLLINHIQLPTVVIVHGGPHSAFALHYMSNVILYARLGLKTLLINYRGSLGINEEYLQSLCGRVGELDVHDCMHVIRYFVQSKMLDPAKLVIQGGSHGGFLSCHLSCQDEFKFTSAIIRNPVVDISSMHSTSDIPDWAFTESLGQKQYDFCWVPGSNDLIQMYECSPMSKSAKAYVPTLMLLGNKDQRVKMYQGERWIDILRARGIETLCKIYPDKHDLGKVDVAADSTVTAVIWILSHLPKL